MIIAVDFDGTLEKNGKMNIGLIRRLAQAQIHGDIVILWTCRNGKRLREAVNRLMDAGLRPNYVNCNAIETVKRLKYDPRKILADVYIDDKAVRNI